MKNLKMWSLSSVMTVGLLMGSPVLSHADMMKDEGMKDKAMMMKDSAMMADHMDADVAISGYCPVCVVHGMMNKGSDHFVTEYKGKVYKFPAMEQQKAFLENPEEYTKDLDMKFKQLSGK